MRIFFRYILTPILTLLIGIAIGKLINDWPKFKINYEVKVTDIFKIVTTIAVGIFIPLIVKKLIDDKRSKNDNLLEELSAFSKMIENMNNYIHELYKNKKIISKDKDYINMQFDITGKEVKEICNFLEENCSTKTSTLLLDMKNAYFSYWQISTSIAVIGSSIRKIDDSTFKNISQEYTEMTKKIRLVKSDILKN